MSEVKTVKFNPEDIYPTPNSGRFKATSDESKTYHAREGIITKVDAAKERATERKRFLQRLDDHLFKIIGICLLITISCRYFGMAFSVVGGAAMGYEQADKSLGGKMLALVNSPSAILRTISDIASFVIIALVLYAIIRGLVHIIKGSRKPLPPPDHSEPPTASIGT